MKTPYERWIRKMQAIVKLNINKERRKGEPPLQKMSHNVSAK